MESIARARVVEVLRERYDSAARHIAELEQRRERLRSQKKKDGRAINEVRFSWDVAHNRRSEVLRIGRELDVDLSEIVK